MMKYYAGIGSRETPASILTKMNVIAIGLSRSSFCLRSGGADGADMAFEKGAMHKQIFLPWDGFNNHTISAEYTVPPMVYDYVQKYHPKPSALSEKGILFMSRNTYQVLGPNLDDPVEFIVCWTKDGKASGGTGQAIRIAKDYNVPVFNLKNDSALNDLNTYLNFNNLIG
jgi:hypothetical protein